MLKLILNDNTKIELVEAGLSQHYVVLTNTVEEFRAIADLLTPENLSRIQLLNGEQVVQTIVGSALHGTQEVFNADGTVTGHIYLRNGTFVDDNAEYAAAGRILLGEEGYE